MTAGDESLAGRLNRLNEAIYQATVRDRPSVLSVTVGSPLDRAIQRGEFRWAGLEPGMGNIVMVGDTPVRRIDAAEEQAGQ